MAAEMARSRRALAGRGAVASAVVAFVTIATATPAGAHGVGGRGDLPLPVWMFAYGAGFALLISFVALRLLWPSPRLAAAAEGRTLSVPAWLRAGASVALRLVGLAGFALTVTAAALGTTDAGANWAPVGIYVIFWVGLQLVSALVGDVWRSLSPFDTLAGLTQWARHRRWSPTPEPLPDDGHRRTSHWPAAIGIGAFAWLELAYHSPASPRVLALGLGAYSVAMFVGAGRFGRAWLRTGDGFGVLFGLLAHLAPLGRDPETGRWRVRLPTAGLSEVVARPGTVALVVVTLGSTTFDGVTRTRFWAEVIGTARGWEATVWNTAGLLWVIALVAAAYAGAAWAIERTTGERADGQRAADAYVHSLVPIMLAYAIAHYFSLLVFEGQGAVALLSDPLGRGWDLFGTAANTIDYRAVTTATIAWVQALAIVVGHVAGVAASHDRAVETLAPDVATRSQYPMLAVMVVYTVSGLALLLGA